ncbi:outer membrane beta-barrel domain-containing protein [Bdellovibrio sp. HCB-110]|uniref:outer membrane beta-barrel domain-containing protein n=1 Tax=Bdellovibrio sp. HCB-110 TaxID=3391182 RepID=UPI0039B6DD5B
MAVKNRVIPFAHRLEVGLLIGTVIDEMFFNSSFWGFQSYYNLNEDIALGIKYAERASGLSSYSEQFYNTSAQVDFNKAPGPGSIIMASCRWSFLYGKMSFSKNYVFPTTFAAEVDGGVNRMGDETMPYASAGLTHKVFFKKHLGIGASYRLLFYQTLDTVSTDLGSSAPTPAGTDFEKKIQVSQSLELGFTFLF